MKKPLSIPTSLQKVYDPSAFRRYGHEMVDLLANHLASMQNEEPGKVLSYQDPAEELNFWQDHFAGDHSISATFSTILARSIKVHHPNYIGHQVSVPAPIASIAGMLSDLLNNGTGVYEMGMASNALEKIIIDLVNQKIGFPNSAGGFMTSGGTLANLTALLAARKAKLSSDIWKTGHDKPLAIMVSEASHYCIDRAARIMGLGTKGIIKIPVDETFKIRVDLLPEYLEKAKKDGLTVFAIVGCACSTATGSYDPLDKIAGFAQANNLWFHVDGAHGGGVIFSEKYRPKTKGIDQADSVVIDFHKMLLTPALTTALLFKNELDSYKTFSQQAAYLWNAEQAKEWYHSGKRTFECTKLMMSIKVYSIIKAHGENIFGENYDHLYGLTHSFARLISNNTNFTLLLEPESNILNFRFTPKTKKDLNLLNEKIQNRLVKEGNFYIVSVVLGETRYLRCSVMNPFTTEAVFEQLLEEIISIGNQLLA